MSMVTRTQKAQPPPGGAPPFTPRGSRVRVSFLDGQEAEGVVIGFNPQQDGFFLHAPRGSAPSAPRAVAFESVKAVHFLRDAERTDKPAPHSASASVVRLRFSDGETLRGVTQSHGGQRRGLYLTPITLEGIERIYVPMTAIREVVSEKRLGEIMAEQGLAMLESIRKALSEQQAIRQEPIGQILIRRHFISEQHLLASLKLQKRAGKLIGEILLEEGFIDADQLSEALRAQEQQRGKKFGTIMVEMGFATYKMIAIALALQYNLSFVDLSAQPLDPDLLRLAPAEMWRRLRAVPVRRHDELLTIAVSDPTDHTARDEITLHTRLKVLEAVATEDGIRRALNALGQDAPAPVGAPQA